MAQNKTLMQGLKPALTGQPQPPTAPTAGETEQKAAGMLRTKLTGKAGQAPGGPRRGPGLASLQAQAQTNQAQRQQTKVGQMQMAGMEQREAAQQQQEEIETANLMDRYDEAQAQLSRQNDALLNNFERAQQRMDDREQAQLTERVGFNLRFQNKDYITNLQREGQRARLQDANKFKEQLARDMFAEEQGLLRNELASKAILDADDRHFDAVLTNMGVNELYDNYKQEKKAEKQRAIWGALGTVGGIGASSMAGGSDSKAPSQEFNDPDTFTVN